MADDSNLRWAAIAAMEGLLAGPQAVGDSSEAIAARAVQLALALERELLRKVPARRRRRRTRHPED